MHGGVQAVAQMLATSTRAMAASTRTPRRQFRSVGKGNFGLLSLVQGGTLHPLCGATFGDVF
jgi:hypothetical protein